jgi:hypothetical protein
MIDALESLNLAQESQSNANEMSWDEKGCFGSAQYAHKYVKCPRVRAKSRPPSIYRRTPSKRAVGQISWATNAYVAHPTDTVPASVAPPSATRQQASKFQQSSSNRWTRLSPLHTVLVLGYSFSSWILRLTGEQGTRLSSHCIQF